MTISDFQPGTDGNCIAIVYTRETNPQWVMVTCYRRVAFHWICKNQLRAHNLLQPPVYPSLRCRKGFLLIHDICYEHKQVPSLSNDSVACVGDKPYLSYLNQNFAERGINMISTIGCTVKKEYGTRVQGRMALQHRNVNHVSTNVKVLQLHKTYTNLPICGPTTQKCEDGSCRAQSIVCILDFDCAPNVCACMVNNQLSYDREYCRHHCPPGRCTCAPLMFQCSIGGCIPYLHICDNEYDCADSSDEFCVLHAFKNYHLRNTPLNVRFLSTKSFQLCFDFICSNGQCIDIHLVNDLIPDCFDASDEYHSLTMKYGGSYFRCSNVQEIPCMPGHSKCFGIHNLCVYDLDHFGQISYCRDGAHLINCLLMNCTNSFKCPGSYCIPLRKVCDGVHDCRDGDDEINCHNNSCPGYLKCSGVEFCIHLEEVCDDYSHCPYGEDEAFCDILGCPVGCTCLWYGLLCRDTRLIYIPEIPFQDVIYLSVGLNYEFELTFTNLSSLSRLIILDLSSSMISNICPALQDNYRFYESLHALYLQMNDIKYLSSFCFDKLSSLHVINLQGNHLITIATDAFKGISLDVLILKDTLLSPLSGHWIDGFYSLKTLNKRGVKLNYWSQTVINGLAKLERVNTDDARLCCILHNIKGCYNAAEKHMKCIRLLSKSAVGPLLIFVAFANFIFIMITIKLVKSLFSTTRPLQCFLHKIILMNKSIYVCYILAIATIDVYFGKHYILWYSSFVSKVVCQAVSTLLSIAIVMYNITVAFRDHIVYMAVSRILFNEDDVYSKVKKFLFMCYLLLVAGFGPLAFLLNEKHMAHQSCASPLGVSMYDYKWATIGPVLVCSIILLSLTYSVFTYSAIYKTTYLSGICIQTISSPQRDIQQTRLYKLMKILSQSTIFRCLECLPILCTTFAKLCGITVSLDIQMMSILVSTIFGSFTSEIKPVWYPMFTKNKI